MRVCLRGRQDATRLDFSRFESLARRFIDWREQNGCVDFAIVPSYSYSFDFDVSTLAGWKRLLEAVYRRPQEGFPLGGLRLRDPFGMRIWLAERKAIGMNTVSASFAGHGTVYDRWVGREGDFEFMTQTLRTAGALGMGRSERLFLAKSTLPLIGQLLEKLDAIPGTIRDRYFSLFFYRGAAVSLEHERITERDRDHLPACVTNARMWMRDSWLSEREWIHAVREAAESPQRVHLNLDVSAANIGLLEKTPCGELLATLEARTRKAYAAMPGLPELSKACGNPANTRVYMCRDDIESKWLDQYLANHSYDFDRSLTHLYAAL